VLEQRARRYSKPIAVVPPRERHVVAARIADRYIPDGFERVHAGKCASPECRSAVAFVHKRTRQCLACATKAGIRFDQPEEVAAWRNTPAVVGDDTLAERIALANRIRELAGPEGTILGLLEGAMEGPAKNARRNGSKAARIEKPKEEALC
jgi:hypothetical protein